MYLKCIHPMFQEIVKRVQSLLNSENGSLAPIAPLRSFSANPRPNRNEVRKPASLEVVPSLRQIQSKRRDSVLHRCGLCDDGCKKRCSGVDSSVFRRYPSRISGLRSRSRFTSSDRHTQGSSSFNDGAYEEVPPVSDNGSPRCKPSPPGENEHEIGRLTIFETVNNLNRHGRDIAPHEQKLRLATTPNGVTGSGSRH